ncbi:hypothetical protein NAEGRDRAFT_57402 [Naegleria gruberi]|uniref:Uncharacterized protein n=1 Tax=Naegleria gruberi TaxID=5762 RepID=D2V7P0_NAEGR|nr:uncharacterized protein NAEGRDRAFT_57402 [Naegleria gruberi]EFC47035.1 hypothetical protein NAEGRDRAFT_57402 [Naegleria gruberi]|eukprot:XP_002679779.1 hypothetical protein NAEGRDRAFT_57402 [Naegleria gruberi strain NEG-M]
MFANSEMNNSNNRTGGVNSNNNNNTNQRFGTSSFNSINSSSGNRSTSSNWQANQTTPTNNRNYSTTNQQNNSSTEGLFTSVFTQTANIGTIDPSGDENQLNRQFVQSANLIAQFYTSSLLAYRKSYQQGVKKSFRRLSSLLLQYSNQQQTQNAQIPINLVLTMMNQVLQEELAANTTNTTNNNTNNANNNNSNNSNNHATTTMNSEPMSSSIMNNGENSPPNRASTTSPMSSLSVHNSISSNGNSPQQTNKNDDAMPSSPINNVTMLNSDSPLTSNNNNNNNCTIATMSNESQQSIESSNLSSSNSLLNNNINTSQGIAPLMNNNNNTTISNQQQQVPPNPFAFPFQFNPLSNLPNTTISGPFDFSSLPTDYSFANALLSGSVTTQQLSYPNHPHSYNSTNSTTRSSNHHHHQHSQHHKGSCTSHQRSSFYNGSFSQNSLKRDFHMLNVPNNCDEDEDDEAPRFLFRSINTTMNGTSSSNTIHNNISTNANSATSFGANMINGNNSFPSENTSLSPSLFSDHIPSSGQNTGDFSELSPLTQIFKKNRI